MPEPRRKPHPTPEPASNRRPEKFVPFRGGAKPRGDSQGSPFSFWRRIRSGRDTVFTHEVLDTLRALCQANGLGLGESKPGSGFELRQPARLRILSSSRSHLEGEK